MLSFIRARAIHLNGERLISQDAAVGFFWYAQASRDVLNCETINSESMWILIKAKWRKNRDKTTRIYFIISRRYFEK